MWLPHSPAAPPSPHDCTLPIRKRRGRWNPTCTCLFSCLSDAVCQRIVSFLPLLDTARMCFVSTRWHHVIVASPALWARVALDAQDPGCHRDALALLASSPFGPMVREFEAPKLRCATDASVAPRLPAATFINLRHAIVTPEFAAATFRGAPSLTALFLDAASGVDGDALTALSETATSIATLSLRGCVRAPVCV